MSSYDFSFLCSNVHMFDGNRIKIKKGVLFMAFHAICYRIQCLIRWHWSSLNIEHLYCEYFECIPLFWRWCVCVCVCVPESRSESSLSIIPFKQTNKKIWVVDDDISILCHFKPNNTDHLLWYKLNDAQIDSIRVRMNEKMH